MYNTLLTLSDGDKRIIFSLLLILIVAIVFIGLLGYILFRLMKWQSKKMDSLVHDVVVTKVIDNKKAFIKYGRYKNWALFFKQSYIPIIIILFSFAILIIHNSIYGNWAYNPFSTYDGFGTIFFTWKHSGKYTDGALIRFAKLVVDNRPHLVASAWAGYIFGPCILAGGLWYIIVVSCFLSRTILLYKRSGEIFEKSLDGYHQDEANQQNLNNNNQQ